MRLVMKFGGASVKDGRSILHCANLVKKFSNGNEIIVVTSAMYGVTDSLLHAARKCCNEPSAGFIKLFIAEMMKKHYDAVNEAVRNDEIKSKVLSKIDKLLDELEKVLLGINYLGELTPRSLDYILSFGERLSAPILSAALLSSGVDSLALEGGDAGIITDDSFGRARPLPEVYGTIKSRLEPLISLKKTVPVVAGFTGVTKNGTITTLGRGGSDLTATLIASALNADEVWLWKEVDGVMTTDPKIVPEARLISEISYQEAMELSHFGAKILHPKALEPVMKKRIPVRIKNTFNPDAEGTVIRESIRSTKDIVKAISLIEKVAILNISGAGFDFAEVMADVFRKLAENKVHVIMVSQSSSELNLSIVVDEADISRAVKALEETVNGAGRISKIENIAVISAVGAGMAGTPGVAGRIFSALGRNRINVVMISQSCSEYNVSLVVRRDEGRKAVRVLHDEFGLSSG